MNTLVNGQAGDYIAVRDRGFAYGDGVFRTLKCDAGRLLAWPRHYAKLAADCVALGIRCPAESILLADLAQLAPENAAVKLTISRGLSARGYACDPNANPTRIVQIGVLPTYPADLHTVGVHVRLCDWLLSIQAGLAGVKHLNRLDQVMARREWDDTVIFDGLMSNARAEVVEGVMTNLYLLKDGILYTHPLADCGVAGVMRDLVLEASVTLRIPTLQQPFTVEALALADAVLLSNSLAGVVPVAQCGTHQWHNFTTAQRLHAAVVNQSILESTLCRVA
ncbi:aminodeoxychorismate lyase [Chitinimonas sp. BJB300]|uniref:aminodeoxychorismate lyase n=1 Tax=Chitinimonas sp. BJB300 TaxID=1559339 RepID=UPI000C0CB415|nr:aminodeoxychorismate lyase [Chitinimonas sp. BJB300]PHV12563.1 aminodeoxychorismate lyase [Chitinimonas sp. BJB300]TSJ90043.1 aminodeoxychorismate lyase [Chitinimonas sp. BJB300]